MFSTSTTRVAPAPLRRWRVAGVTDRATIATRAFFVCRASDRSSASAPGA